MTDIWKQAATTLAVVVIAMASFWLVEARKYVTQADVDKLILGADYPWLKDRELVMAALADRKETTASLGNTIQANTKAINELRVVLAEIRTELRVRNEDKP